MKKYITLFIVCSLFACFAFGCQQKKDENKDNNTPGISDIIDETEQKQGDILIHDININSHGASNTISGKVKNEGTDISGFTLELNMFQKENNKLIGTTQTKIKKLKPGAEQDFQISVVGDYKKVNKFSVHVLNLVKTKT